MQCFLQQDYPKRLQAGQGSVVHAAKPYGGERSGTLETACGRRYYIDGRSTSDWFCYLGEELDNTTLITCKNCQRDLGMTTQEKGECEDDLLFVLVEKETGMFFNSGGGKHTQWVERARDATLFKTRKGAEDAGKRDFYYDPDGNEINCSEYYKGLELRYSENPRKVALAKKYQSEQKFDSARFEIKTVWVSLV